MQTASRSRSSDEITFACISDTEFSASLSSEALIPSVQHATFADPAAATSQLLAFSQLIQDFNLSIVNSPSLPAFDAPPASVLQETHSLLERFEGALHPSDLSASSSDLSCFELPNASAPIMPSSTLLKLIWQNCRALMEIIVSLSVYFSRYSRSYERTLVELSHKLKDPCIADVFSHLQSSLSPPVQSTSLLVATLMRQENKEQNTELLSQLPSAMRLLLRIGSLYLETISPPPPPAPLRASLSAPNNKPATPLR